MIRHKNWLGDCLPRDEARPLGVLLVLVFQIVDDESDMSDLAQFRVRRCTNWTSFEQVKSSM